ncbi:hypothetical protein BSKO_04650 [Bryopsis sp. KO-2023]|nr:hypothetical protein BSKO_04650 [Bryopsis sp. KO-2023]
MQWITDSINSLFATSTTEQGQLQHSGNLTIEQIMKFFDAGHKMFDDEGVKEQLRSAAQRRQNVGWLITEMQKKIFESQGINGNFGIGFLGKIRQMYGTDSSIMEALMMFVEREELALDEAELPVDQLLRKLEMKEWSMKQYETMQQELKHMTPEQQLQYMNQQQSMMKAMTNEQKDIMSKAQNMGPEEQRKFIADHVKKLQERFSMNATAKPGCKESGCGCGPPGASQPTPPTMGNVMSPEEQMQFFKSINKGPM